MKIEMIEFFLMVSIIFFSQKTGWHDYQCYKSGEITRSLIVFTLLSFVSCFTLGILIFYK